MHLSRSGVGNPVEIARTESRVERVCKIPDLSRLYVRKYVVQRRNGPDQFNRHLPQPFGEVVTLILLPIVITTHNFDLVKLR